MASNSLWITLSMVLVGVSVFYLRAKYNNQKRETDDDFREKSISILIDDLPEGINEHRISGVIRRPNELFLCSGIFTCSPALLLEKKAIRHKSRILLTNQSIVILDWDSETRWDWGNLGKVERSSNGFTIYPQEGLPFTFITESIKRPEIEVISLIELEGATRGAISKIPVNTEI
ncbi:hypothetical protein VCHA50P415_30536 [Vibrio chagasii]|nr:hypothetical protein VCHA50P415_30536 [Vibrio chagasii]